jgi:hypothetical protein
VVIVTPTGFMASHCCTACTWTRRFGNAAFRGGNSSHEGLEGRCAGHLCRTFAIRIGEGTFYYSPEIVLPQLLYILPQDTASAAEAARAD